MAGKTKEDMKVGVTGHQKLDVPSNWEWVRNELHIRLQILSKPLIGVTSLAIGADQLFATAVLEQGGTLEVIVPFAGYESKFSDGPDREVYLDLLQRAKRIDVLKRHGTDQDAYLAAGKAIVDRSDLIFAVWDGRAAEGLGGTGDVVEYAVQKHKRTMHLDPINHSVTEI